MEKIANILSDLCELGDIVIVPELELQNDLALDSLSMVLLLSEIEDAFNIELEESDLNPFDLITVQDVINLVEKYCNEE